MVIGQGGHLVILVTFNWREQIVSKEETMTLSHDMEGLLSKFTDTRVVQNVTS